MENPFANFYDENGQIVLPASFTLAALCEGTFQKAQNAGAKGELAITFFDYSTSHEGRQVKFTRGEANTRIKAVAGRLQQVAQPGTHVALMMGNSPEYLFGFLGALYANMVPVPLYDPNEPGHSEHLTAVIADCEPKVVLTNKTAASAVRRRFAPLTQSERPRILAVDALPDATAAAWEQPQHATDRPVEEMAFLQYTSGSTRTPAGVVLTNRSIIANIIQIFSMGELRPPVRMVSWLPLHHDMGLILSAFMLILGIPLELMTPQDFIQQPKRWLQRISRDELGSSVNTVVPNFALELAARYGKPEEGETYDFSDIESLLVGSEAVTPRAINQFCETFGRFNLKRNCIRPGYGLAEASLLVAGPHSMDRPRITYLDRAELSKGRAKQVSEDDPNAQPLTSVGEVVEPQWLVAVNPETREEVEDGMVGELWVYGPNLASGYYQRDGETKETFANQLARAGKRAAGAPEGVDWMATGDLGVFVDDEVYITGRRKELIVIAGRNHYPQDIEYTVDHADSQIRPGAVAAFAIPAAEGADSDGVERLVILAERDLDRDPSGDGDAVARIRTAVANAHGVVPFDIQILAPDEIQRSSSGKIARRVCRKAYLAA